MSAVRPLSYAVVAAVWLHHVAIAFLAPIAGDDWTMALDGPSWPTVAGLYHALIVESRVAHVLLTPILAASLPVGLVTLARGRRLSMTDGADVLLLALVATGIWLVAPRYVLTSSYRAAVAAHVVGLALAVWFVVGFRAAAARGRLAAVAIPAFLVAGFLAGATTRPIAAAALVACGWIVTRASRREPWMLAGLAGLVAGAALVWVPDLDVVLDASFDRGFEQSVGLVNLAFRGPAVVVAGVMLVWVGQIAWCRWRGRAVRQLDDAAVAAMTWAVAIAVLMTAVVVAAAAPTSFELTGVGAALTVVIAYLVAHLGGSRRGRAVVAVALVLIQIVVIALSLRALVPARRQFDARTAALRAAPAGSVARIPPYRPAETTAWFLGEDLITPALRARVATEHFELRGIELSP